MQCAIPAGALVMLVGEKGSGKSTFAQRNFQPTEVVSSAFCRALVSDDASDQDATGDALELLTLIVEKRLRRGRTTVVDALNIQPARRAPFLEIARQAGAVAVAIVFDMPAAIWQNRELGLEGVLDDDAPLRQAAALGATREVLEQEGFARCYVLRSPEAVEAACVVIDEAAVAK